MAKKRKGKTSTDQGHSHTYSLDTKGNGETSRDNLHSHSVKNFKVSPAGIKNHTHTLK
jgi:hypothetical protein